MYLESLRQPAQVRPARAPAGPHQADRRGQQRGRDGRRRAAVDLDAVAGRHRAGAVRTVRRDPRRHGRRPVRRRVAAHLAAAARRARRGGRRQLDRTRRARQERLRRRGIVLGAHRRRGGRRDAGRVRNALRDVVADDGVDAVVAVFVPPLQPHSGDEVASAAARGGRRVHQADPVDVPRLRGRAGIARRAAAPSSPAPGSVPSYASPERAVRALARAQRYSAWRQRPRGTVPELAAVDLAGAHELVDGVLAADPDGRALTGEEAGRLLGCVGIVVSNEVPADSVAVVLGARDDPSFGALAWFGIAGRRHRTARRPRVRPRAADHRRRRGARARPARRAAAVRLRRRTADGPARATGAAAAALGAGRRAARTRRVHPRRARRTDRRAGHRGERPARARVRAAPTPDRAACAAL